MSLFDTFEGMTQPSSRDVDYSGAPASKVLLDDPSHQCEAPVEQVREMLYASGYPKERFHFVKGRVEETIPASAPQKSSLLRLDTEWHASTKHELVRLFPRLVRTGVLIIDDYGHRRGSREACDEYFGQNRIPMLLNPIDYTGRIGTKLETMAEARGEAQSR